MGVALRGAAVWGSCGVGELQCGGVTVWGSHSVGESQYAGTMSIIHFSKKIEINCSKH